MRILRRSLDCLLPCLFIGVCSCGSSDDAWTPTGNGDGGTLQPDGASLSEAGDAAASDGTSSDGTSSDGAGGVDLVTLEPQTGDWNASPHPLVYLGHADPWQALNDGAADWKYVQTNADGLYVNFIVADMQWGTTDKILAELSPTADLMRNKNLFYEGDQRDGTEANDKRDLEAFSAAGLTTTHATYNYTILDGWNEQRANVLRTHSLAAGQASRPALVLLAPWDLGGDVMSSYGNNAEVRHQLEDLADGFSSDGPLGFWKSNEGGFREASYSLVTYGKKLDKFQGMMLAPYAAGVAGYSAKEHFLSASIEYVLAIEDHSGSPSAWLIWEYAETFPATPEANADGTPMISTTGVAYWLLHHLKGEEVKLTKLSAFGASEGTLASFTLENTSAWCVMSPALRAEIDDPAKRWNVRITLDGTEVTSDLVSSEGYVLAGARNLDPLEKHGLDVVVTCKDCTEGAAPPAKPTVRLSVLGHRDVPKPVQVWTIR